MKKTFSRITAFLVVLCMSLGCTSAVFASTAEENVHSSDSGRKILYQDENILLYQSKDEPADVIYDTNSVTRESNYGNVWLDRTGSGSFRVYNTHTGKIGVTWKVESSSNSSYAQIYMTTAGNIPVLATKTVRPSDGDVHLVISNGASYYDVHYLGYTTVGMRIMCWTYK